MLEDILQRLHPKVREVLLSRFKYLTPVQEKAFPLILEGKNVLIVAPTGSGKTEAAVIPVLSRLLSEGVGEKGINILYITPLRALNRDLLDRLEWWCSKLGLSIGVRHGDTDQKERTKQAKNPPHMLITTPETLQLLLYGRLLRKALKNVKYVIVDEVHEIAEDKRGSQLSLALERLRYLAERDFQIIGLSATVGSPKEVAQFLAGIGRKIEVVEADVTRQMDIKVIYPRPLPEDEVLAAKLYTVPEVAARLRIIADLIKKHRSALVFTNTRAIAEVLASRFRIWDRNVPLDVHHSSLSKLSRIVAERGLKSGELKALVCTSSLELGIDVGRIDIVIQYMSPRQVTRLVQRVGRAGHSLDRVAKGIIVTDDEDDTLEAAVIARRALEGKIEETKMPEKPYDVLCHQIVALFFFKRRWRFSEILDLYTKAYPYRNLSKEDLVKVLSYMHNRYPRLAWVSFEDEIVLKPKNTRGIYEYFFNQISTIPDEKQYLVVNIENDEPLGVLDEAFVAEYGEIGVKFVFRGSVWIIKDISRDRIYVEPAKDPTGAVPSWVGEEIPVPLEVALEVGAIKRYLEQQLRKGLKIEEVAEDLVQKYPIDKVSLANALRLFAEHVKKGYKLPTDKRVLIEKCPEGIVVHVHGGTLANRALSRYLAEKIIEATGYGVKVQQDPYSIIVVTSANVDGNLIKNKLLECDYDDFRNTVVTSATRQGLFKRRLIHVARRFGALPKGVEASTLSMRKLVEAFEGTVIFEEALKEYMAKDVSIEEAWQIIEGIQRGEIEVIVIESEEASPVTAAVLNKMAKKLELIPPERLEKIIVESAKTRLLNTVLCFVCLNCKWYSLMKVKDFIKYGKCPKCGSRKVGVANAEEKEIEKIINKNFKAVSKQEIKLIDFLQFSSRIIEKYNSIGAVVLAGRGLKKEEIIRIVEKHSKLDDSLIKAIIEAEKKALSKRFW
ncbi:MAG: ATP-dependent helicase [Thermoprotei archaeon]|nr:MAG: ATP-dependent helicase [Thermoprotei archaeon]